MKSPLNKLAAVAMLCAACCPACVRAQSAADSLSHAPLWHVGAGVAAGVVPGTNRFLTGDNSSGKSVDADFAASVRAGFRFSPYSRLGQLYPGVYQGLGLEARTFSAGGLLGSPVSLYVYQGVPLVHFGPRLWLGAEWQFGAAFGWKHFRAGIDEENGAVSTAVTAHMGVGLRLNYELSASWRLTGGIDLRHFSNGNTSYPNAGVNTTGLSLGLTYLISQPQPQAPAPDEALVAEADAGRWMLDIVAYGAWRKRGVTEREDAIMVPGRFGVAGVQVAPMRKFNRWLAAGASLDMQYDQSAGIEDYWVEGTWGNDVKFYRPPFGKQLSVGLSAHAELTLPVFAINAGLGYDFVCPEGDRPFYQSLTLKAFVTRNVFLNVGYRLRHFKDPQNLMLGIGVRL